MGAPHFGGTFIALWSQFRGVLYLDVTLIIKLFKVKYFKNNFC